MKIILQPNKNRLNANTSTKKQVLPSNFIDIKLFNPLGKLALCFTIMLCFFSPYKGIAQVPSDLIKNCKQWSITLPTGDVTNKLCDDSNNEFFYVNEDGDAIVFHVPIRSDNGSTPNSSYIRSELREKTADGSKKMYWSTEGKHMIYVKQSITHLPMNKPHMVATQIHGNKSDGIDDAMVMRLQGSHLYLSFNGAELRENLDIKRNYSLGTVHEVIFLVIDGKHYCYYAEDNNLLKAFQNNNAHSYLIKDGNKDHVMDIDYDQAYFKVGNYTQSNPDKEGDDTNDPHNYGEVLVYNFFVGHGDTLSVPDIDKNDKISIYPNPTTNFLVINEQLDSKYELYSQLGSNLLYGHINSNKFNIGLQNFSTGIYFLKIENTSGTHIRKIIKK